MIIVTGGAGFIGSNIVAGLEEKGYKDIVVVDWLGNEDKWKNIAKRNLSAIVSPEDLDVFLENNHNQISAIIHMGAISTTTEKDVDLIKASNIDLTWKLWCFCRDFKKQFIFASSAATYGSGENGFNDNDGLEYLNSLRPLNPYGWSKAFIDRKIAFELSEKRPTPPQFVGLKFFNVYGPNEYHKGGQKSVVAHIFPLVQKNEEVLLFKSYHPDYKDGWQLRDFVWIEDIVNVIIWMLEHKSVSGLFNVGSGEARSFYDLAASTWIAMGKEPKIGFKDMPEELKGKYQYYTKANIDKLRSIGYTAPMTKLEDGIRQYVQNYLNKEDSYR
ncbi:MAG: ADP-glyceromanno-heptose 6-epimerase [Alphaproteobacteria bacterium]|nr:ADP-glyceromanno-heptose 6-epimerase [Alphaproteobacteria bacterium]